MGPADEILEEVALVRCRVAGMPSPAARAADMLARARAEKRQPTVEEMVQAAGLLVHAAERELIETRAAKYLGQD